MPIVASRGGAIPELMIDRRTGTLVAPGDPAAIADALFAYASNPELRHRHGEAARARAIERFDIEDCARAYRGLFADLASRKAARNGRSIAG
jgi:glycosyltransferase involved in cell wall biosynthesis